MKKTIKIVATVAGLAVIFAFANAEKKLNKVVNKVWKGQEVQLEKVELPDSISKDFTCFNKVILNDETVGYACYTTAFGCRIGGCPAPSNPNVQSYETFDYIVVYDAELNIKKVDIANYGGDYGYEICNPRWLSQFIGMNQGFKLNDNIDGISGATVSAQYLIDDLNGVGNDLKTYFATQADL
jgi:hypothetical protein